MSYYKYTFKDLGCKYCQLGRRGCKYVRCPYLVKEAPNLINDDDFNEAVENAEECDTYQKQTLLYFKKNGIPRGNV